MARLPIPGQDTGTWGTVLNDYLSVVHTSDGELKTNSVGAAQIQPSSVTSSAITTNAINSTHLQDGVVTHSKMDGPTTASLAKADSALQVVADSSITAAKLDPTVNQNINLAVATMKVYDIRRFIQAGETLVSDGSSAGNNSAIFQRAVNTATAAYVSSGITGQVYVPNGRYILAQTGTDVSHGINYAVLWATGVSLKGESEAGVVFLSDANSTPICGAYPLAPLVDCTFETFTVDCAAQTNATYTTQLKGIFIQDMIRPRWTHITIKNCWATGLGCDYLQQYVIDHVTTIGNGRGVAATSSNPLLVSGGCGVGIGTGRYQVESGVITGLTSSNNGRGGLFFEKQRSATFFSRGTKVIGAILTSNFFGLHDCGCDGLDADIVATDNTYAGILLDTSTNSPKAGYNGRITGRIDRNGSTAVMPSGNVVLGTMPTGMYRIGDSSSTAQSSPLYGIIATSTAVLGPQISIHLAADYNGASGIYIQNFGGATIKALSIAGSASNNGQDATQTRREGITLSSSTDFLQISSNCLDTQVTPTQQTGLYTMGSGRTINRGKLTADVRGNVVAGWTNEQTISGDTIQSIQNFNGAGPSNLRATAFADGAVTLAWNAPTPSTGVTDYSMQYRLNGTSSWSTFAHSASTTTSQTITGLQDNVAYDFQVAAVVSGTIGSYTAGPMTTSITLPNLYADLFTRADSDLTGSTAADGTTPGTWALFDSATGDGWSVKSNVARPLLGSGVSLPYIDTAQSNGTVSASLSSVGVTVPQGGIAFRITDAKNYMRVALRQSSGVVFYTVQRIVNSAITNIITTTTVPAVNDIFKIVFNGSSLKLYVNGALIGSGTDATYNTNTKHGFWGIATDTNTKYFSWSYNIATT